MDAIKTSHNWNDEATFCNATSALFVNIQRVVHNWAVLDKDNYAKTWTYLKKNIMKSWGDIKDSRSFIITLFSIRKRPIHLII